MTRWLSLNYNISALSLSSDSTRLLVCLANRVQELELLDNQDIREREREGRLRMFRQLHLPHTQSLDPVIKVR